MYVYIIHICMILYIWIIFLSIPEYPMIPTHVYHMCWRFTMATGFWWFSRCHGLGGRFQQALRRGRRASSGGWGTVVGNVAVGEAGGITYWNNADLGVEPCKVDCFSISNRNWGISNIRYTIMIYHVTLCNLPILSNCTANDYSGDITI